MSAPAELDHVVVNALRGMDAAAALFAGLGFALTPLGRHSLGSVNHLVMTPGPYLELVGVPAAGLQRREVLDSPFGLNGLVLRSEDAEATRARLLVDGFLVAPVSAFSRPVVVDGQEVEARFETVRVQQNVFPAGRVYFCHHLTPDYVWRPEWLTHPNTFEAIEEIAVASRDPEAEARRYAQACSAAAERDGAIWRVRLGAFTILLVADERPRFLSLGLRFRDLGPIRERARATAGTTWEAGDGAARLTLAALDLQLDCRGAA